MAQHKATTATGAASVKQRQPSAGEASPGQSANICFQFILAMSHKLWTEAGMLIIPQVSTSTVGITHYGLAHSSITRLGHTLVGEPKTKEDDSDFHKRVCPMLAEDLTEEVLEWDSCSILEG